ncbi:antibiotic biosynthesis monooxygenase [Pseudomonas sp. P4795]|uniref:antibiotic biosynthesis monooxygenase n=1 Tax=Pseudomonas sp. P4795 TaxID=3409915 RepID=UPI003B594446
MHPVHCHSKGNLWIVTSQWESREAMEDHLNHPALFVVMRLPSSHAVSKISARGFLKSGA